MQFTPQEYEILRKGEISEGRYVGGGLLGTVVGYGIGHAVQGRWSDKGWIFTVGELASVSVIVITATSCIAADLEGRAREDRCMAALVGSLVAYTGFRIWEIIDLWAAPPNHNRRVRELRYRAGAPTPRYGFYLAPTSTNSGVAGFSLVF